MYSPALIDTAAGRMEVTHFKHSTGGWVASLNSLDLTHNRRRRLQKSGRYRCIWTGHWKCTLVSLNDLDDITTKAPVTSVLAVLEGE